MNMEKDQRASSEHSISGNRSLNELNKTADDGSVGGEPSQWHTVYRPTTVTLKYKHHQGIRRYAASLKHLLPVRVRTGPGSFMPVDQAGCCTFTFFSWLTPLLWRIFRKGFSLSDIYHCSPFDSSRVNGARLSSLWDQEVKTKGLEKSSLRNVLFHFIRTRFLLSCVMYILCVSFGFLGPTIFMRLLLQYIQSPELDHIVGIKWMIGLVVCELMRVVFMSLMWAIGTRTAIRANSGILALLYFKMMRVRPVVSASLGELINSFANDSQKIFMMVYNSPLVIGGPLVIIGTFIYTWWILGAVSLVGVGIFGMCYALQFCISYLNVHYRKQAVAATDERVSIMTELLMYIRLIKLYAWEKPLVCSVRDARSQERSLLEKCQYLQVLGSSIAGMSSVIVTIVTILVYTSIGYHLTAAQAFTLVMVYSIAGHGIRIMPLCFQDIVNGSVALKRLQVIMKLEERENYITLPTNPDFAVCISKATLSWDPITPSLHSADKTIKGEVNLTLMENEKGISADLEPSPDASLVISSNECHLQPSLVDINLTVPKGKLVGVCGMVGSGKSSLLAALLGQKRLLKGQVTVRGTCAYVSQQSWILNGSFRDNIMFGHSFNSKRYYEAIYCCSLTDDIASLPAGDQTEVGERGVNLSGGQKQRINLARALYADKDLYLLDDPLSAVDSHVGKHIFQHCIQGALKEKTVFLVTHQLEYLSECDIVIVMKNGQIVEQGTHQELVDSQSEYSTLLGILRRELTREVQHKEEIPDNLEMESPTIELSPLLAKKLSLTHSRSVASFFSELTESDAFDGHLVSDEKMATGHISWDTYRCFILAAGGYIICAFVIFWFLLQAVAATFSKWWLSHWLSEGGLIKDPEYSVNITDNSGINYYQLVYGVSIGVMVIVTIIMGFLFTKTSLRASSMLHDTILVRVFCCPMHFFDTVPSGRILNIFTRDTDEIDTHLPATMASLLQHIMTVICSLLMMAFVFPWFLLAMIIIGAGFIFLQRIFCAVTRDLKRIENVSRSPIYSHIGTTLQGLPTIRAFQKQEEFISRFTLLVDENASPLYLYYSAMRWLGTRMDILCIVITLVTALFIVFFKGQGDVDASLSGLALALSLQLSGMYQYVVRMGCEVETRFTSVERMHSYIQNLESEAPTSNEKNRPSPDWPTRGRISFRDVTMRYRPGLPLALKGLTFDINPQEKIGIVGRTGSGKSSIGAVLFRLVELTSGTIYIDGVDIGKIGLEDLRSKMSIIPQDPVLFHGTVRYNLDPLDEKDDQELWDSLERTHMKDKVLSLEGGLEALVTEGGENFSVGEKQLLCIARALMRCNKVLVLDEATAAIDCETDSLVHRTIQEVFGDCTVLIIAHRLTSVMNCDRVMVLSDGKIIEFDKPSTLLRNTKSLFAKVMATEPVSVKL